MSRSGFGAALLLIVPVVALRLEQRVLPERAGSCYFGSGVLGAAPVVGGVSREATMQEYRNDKIVVRYDPKTCIHAGDCVRGLPKVFDVGKKPWIDVNGASLDAIAAQVRKCPSGALSYELLKKKA